MKHTIDELKHAARVLKENCSEHIKCLGCPLEDLCDLNILCPDDWEVERIEAKEEKSNES